MNPIQVNLKDQVELFNGHKGEIDNIDLTTYQFTLKGDFIIWFHIRDIKKLNGTFIDDNLLIF